MSSFAIKSAGQWLGKLAVQEMQYLWEVRDKVEELQTEIEWMECFLLDADERQHKNPLIRKWVSAIRDLALEAEDVTEMYILSVSHKRQDGLMNCLKWVTYFWMDAKTLHTVAANFDNLSLKISKMSSRLQIYGVRSSYDAQLLHAPMTKKLQAEQRRTYSHAHQSDSTVGLDLVIVQLINQLMEGTQKILVAHGMGGIGKTALSREVYNICLSQIRKTDLKGGTLSNFFGGYVSQKPSSSSSTQGYFVGCAWAYVSQQFNVGAICKEILNELIKDDKEKRLIDGLEVSQLPRKLFETLKTNNYLVVLDDVWTVGDWKSLEPAFPIYDGSCGSRILVTTRNPQIFSNLGAELVSTWKAETLKEDSSWKLLENKGRFERNALDSSMEALAQKMLNYCKGHPLAIVILGGVLATKKSLEEWESVIPNLQFLLQGDGDSYSGIYDVLALSYYDLHYSLKPCFLHLGHFPEDWTISVEKLYNLWIADGIVTSSHDQVTCNDRRSLEQVADNYLNMLIQKSMIQVDKIRAYRVDSCRIHDLVRDNCLEMTIQENFLQVFSIVEEKETLADARTKMARRLTIHVGKEDGERVLDSLSGKISSLRSLMFIATVLGNERKEVEAKWIISICDKFKLLRVLDFEGGVVLVGALPKEIGNLIYLRYLCLRGSLVTELPSSIRNLKSLLILDLRVYMRVIKLPNVLWEMSSLSYVYFPDPCMSQEEELTKGYTQGYEIDDGSPLILDKLSHLEMVSNVDLDEVAVRGLLELTSMRKLEATCKHKKESLVPFLKSQNINYLILNIDAGLISGDFQMLLSEAHSLRILRISAVRFPTTYISIRPEMFPCNLRELGFWYCILLEDPMPILEKLPNLTKLDFEVSYRGEEMNCSGNAFPELTNLTLDGLFWLKRWNVQEGGLPKLQEMFVCNCPLIQIPYVLPSNVDIRYSANLLPVVEDFHRNVWR